MPKTLEQMTAEAARLSVLRKLGQGEWYSLIRINSILKIEGYPTHWQGGKWTENLLDSMVKAGVLVTRPDDISVFQSFKYRLPYNADGSGQYAN